MKWTLVQTVWVVFAASLVFLMQAGFAAREAGLTRSKNAISVAARLLAGTLLGTLLTWAFGGAFLLGEGSSWLGTSGFFGGGPSGDPTYPARLILHAALACAAASVLSGAVAERIRFVPYLVITGSFVVLVYPIFGRWAFGGWLAQRGFVDFGGAATLHSLGGWLALAGLIAVGPRAGRFGDGRRSQAIPGSSTPLATLGIFLLWLGVIGANVNGGSALVDVALPRVLANLSVAAGAGGMVALCIGWVLKKKPEVELPMNGILAGLIAVSGAAYAMATPAAFIAGIVAGGLVVGAERLLVAAGVDDAVGAVPTHLASGLWGTLCVGLFGDPNLLGTQLSRGAQFKAQAMGLLAGGIFTFVVAFALFKLVGRVMALRVSGDDEKDGLDAVEHGAHTELGALLDVMEEQARTGDLTLRAPVEPFTEMGTVARQFNRVMETVAFTTAQTESLVRTSLDALLTFNTDGIITSSNPAASAIFGYGEREFRQVAITSLFAPSRDKAKGRADLATLVKTFVGQSREVRGQRRSGEEFTMEASFNYVSVGEDEIYTATIRDVTQRKETEAELNRAQAEIRRRMELELADAKAVQKALLPPPGAEAQFPNCEIARHYQSASETGGDWYGLYYTPDLQSLTIYMGDVTGHGLPSALLSGVVCGAVYSSELTHGILGARDPRTANLSSLAERQLRNLADVVNRIVMQTGKGELLMTMAFVTINLRTGQLTFLNAGHNMPYMVKSGAELPQVSNLVSRGSRLGETARPEFEVVHAKLDPGDVVLLYTDGLVENQGPDGRMFSVREMKAVLGSRRSAAEIRDELVTRAHGVWGDQPLADDHSLLVFRWTPQGVPHSVAPAQPRPPRGAA
jgi:ammonium transporter